MPILRSSLILSFVLLLSHCGSNAPQIYGPPNMGGKSQSVEERRAQITSEADGDFFYGRRYYMPKTRFWGYLRKPRQDAKKAQLVIFREDKVLNPDRLPEDGTADRRYGYDHNFEYRIYGKFTGEKAYDPNSDQVLPIFSLSAYKLVDTSPGWLFSPTDHYDPKRITLVP